MSRFPSRCRSVRGVAPTATGSILAASVIMFVLAVAVVCFLSGDFVRGVMAVLWRWQIPADRVPPVTTTVVVIAVAG